MRFTYLTRSSGRVKPAKQGRTNELGRTVIGLLLVTGLVGGSSSASVGRPRRVDNRLVCAKDEACVWALRPRDASKRGWATEIMASSNRVGVIQGWMIFAGERHFTVLSSATGVVGKNYRPRVWTEGTTTPDCVVEVMCQLPTVDVVPPYIRGFGSPTARVELVLFASHGADSTIDLPKGWDITKLEGERWFQVIRGSDSGGSGALLLQESVSTFESAQASVDGPSFATAHLPCAAVGDGEGRMRGGVNVFAGRDAPFNDNELNCAPAEDSSGSFWSPKATRWRFAGQAVGAGHDVRLTVLRVPEFVLGRAELSTE